MAAAPVTATAAASEAAAAVVTPAAPAAPMAMDGNNEPAAPEAESNPHFASPLDTRKRKPKGDGKRKQKHPRTNNATPSTAPPADGSCRDCAIDLCDSD